LRELIDGYQKVSANLSCEKISGGIDLRGDYFFKTGEEPSSSAKEDRRKELLRKDHFMA
jgi:hypothetical protein